MSLFVMHYRNIKSNIMNIIISLRTWTSQHLFQDVRPSDLEKFCNMFQDLAYMVINNLFYMSWFVIYHAKFTTSMLKQSSINKANRSNLKIHHYAGLRFFVYYLSYFNEFILSNIFCVTRVK